MQHSHQDAGAELGKRGTIAAIGMMALFFGAVPASPAPAPVPETIPVAYMVDMSTGQTLFAREEQRRFVPASVVKVMTAYTAFQLIDEGVISPSTPYLISQELEDEWSGEGSSMILKAGERPTFGELLLGATTISGNDASVAMALAATGSLENWLALMNENAAELGMRNTHFGSPNGYPDEGRTFTTAADLALLGEALITRHPALYRRYFGHRTLTWRNITQSNHDPVTGRVAGADGLKTGYTGEAGYTFIGSGEREGRRIVLVLAGAPNTQVRDQTAREFLEWGFSGFEVRQILGKGAQIGRARLQDGGADSVALRTAENVTIAVPHGMTGKVELSILYQGPVMAPVNEGDTIASLRISIEGQPSFEVPLEAASNVGQAGFWQRIGNGLQGLFT